MGAATSRVRADAKNGSLAAPHACVVEPPRRRNLREHQPRLRVESRGGKGGLRMRTAHVLAIAMAAAASAALSLPASAERLCREDFILPLCNKNCVHRDRDITVGRGVRDRYVVIEERRRVR